MEKASDEGATGEGMACEKYKYGRETSGWTKNPTAEGDSKTSGMMESPDAEDV